MGKIAARRTRTDLRKKEEGRGGEWESEKVGEWENFPSPQSKI